MGTTPTAPLRTQQRLFEPQLSSALGWLVALGLGLALLSAGAVPPELTTAFALVVAVLLGLRVLGARAALGGLAFLVRDPVREALYVAATALALVLAGLGVQAALTWPTCVPVGSSLGSLPRLGGLLGGLLPGDIALAVLIGSLTILEPRLFRRSLAVQYMWPSSAGAYWTRWLVRLATPTLILAGALTLHAMTAGLLWGPWLDARASAHEIRTLPADYPLSARTSIELEEDEQVVDALVSLAMCQPDDALARLLVRRMRQDRVRIRMPRWLELEAYVYELESRDE